MIDFHSHFLPCIDDGSSSVEESIDMLLCMTEQNTKTVVATPHFYANRKSIDVFLLQRELALNKLIEYTKEYEKIEIDVMLGAEVAYFNGISCIDRLEDLCIKGTNYMLLELPFLEWSNSVYDEVFNIYQKGIIPIIAHLERYKKFQDISAASLKLRNNYALVQSNADFFLDFFTKGKALKMLKNQEINVLGSDSHNMNNRKPNLGQARDVINKKLDKSIFNELNKFEKFILSNSRDDIISL